MSRRKTSSSCVSSGLEAEDSGSKGNSEGECWLISQTCRVHSGRSFCLTDEKAGLGNCPAQSHTGVVSQNWNLQCLCAFISPQGGFVVVVDFTLGRCSHPRPSCFMVSKVPSQMWCGLNLSLINWVHKQQTFVSHHSGDREDQDQEGSTQITQVRASLSGLQAAGGSLHRHVVERRAASSLFCKSWITSRGLADVT